MSQVRMDHVYNGLHPNTGKFLRWQNPPRQDLLWENLPVGPAVRSLLAASGWPYAATCQAITIKPRHGGTCIMNGGVVVPQHLVGPLLDACQKDAEAIAA